MKIAVYCSAKDSVHERYKQMAARLGTWIGEHKKPLYVYDYQGFYADLKRQIRRMKAEVFIPAEESYCPVFVEHFHELTEVLDKHQAALDWKAKCGKN